MGLPSTNFRTKSIAPISDNPSTPPTPHSPSIAMANEIVFDGVRKSFIGYAAETFNKLE